jgi:hypothetical protein
VQLAFSNFSIYCTEVVKDYDVSVALFQMDLQYLLEAGPHSSCPLTQRKQFMHQMNRE